MSIIAEALKRAEKEKDKKTDFSGQYLDKIAGPLRSGVYQHEEAKAGGSDEPGNVNKTKSLAAVGGLLTAAVIFLTVYNHFILMPYEADTAAPLQGAVAITEGGKETAAPDVYAEAYSDMSSEIRLLEERADTGIEDFKLSGIVWGGSDSWAIINGGVLRVGDTLSGAKVISIRPQKVVMGFKDKEFDLVVR